MSRNFSQLMLHSSTDVHSRSWICVSGKKLPEILENLKSDALILNGWTKDRLNRDISLRLHCHYNTIRQILYDAHGFFPIPIVLALVKLCGSKRDILKKIEEHIEYLKVNSASARPVSAVRRLNGNIAKIIGAFIADGSLSMQTIIAATTSKALDALRAHLMNSGIRYSNGYAASRKQFYVSIQGNKENFSQLCKVMIESRSLLIQTHHTLELTDAYRDSVEAFARWIQEEFNVAPTHFGKKKNAWRVSFSNKILARYLMCFFDIRPGPKTYNASEPQAIRTASFPIRKAFARGVLMFDGCVTKQRKICFTTVSENLFESIQNIWKEDSIKFGISINRQRGEFNLFTTAENSDRKLLAYFEQGTQKEKLIRWLAGDQNVMPIRREGTALSPEMLLKVLREVRCCDTQYLKRRFGTTHTTIRDHLKILRSRGKISLSNHPNGVPPTSVATLTTVFLKKRMHQYIFKKIRERFIDYKHFALFLGINKGTLSAWKVRRNRIPVGMLARICEVLTLDFPEVLKNVEETDRELAELI